MYTISYLTLTLALDLHYKSITYYVHKNTKSRVLKSRNMECTNAAFWKYLWRISVKIEFYVLFKG